MGKTPGTVSVWLKTGSCCQITMTFPVEEQDFVLAFIVHSNRRQITSASLSDCIVWHKSGALRKATVVEDLPARNRKKMKKMKKKALVGTCRRVSVNTIGTD